MADTQPYFRIKQIIVAGDYVSPQQLWHDHEWPRIYTKRIITRIAKRILGNGK